jgi:hypothetical protein
MSGSVNRLRFKDLPDGSVALEGILLIKYIDPEGSIRYAEMSTASLHPVEALGMVKTAEDTLRARLMMGSREHDE